jgi:saccharopine dehydrogenase-like NADP-dependent oxidoreductase
MRILLVGAGGVGSAFCSIAMRRDFFDQLLVCDYDESRAKQAADVVGDKRFSAAQVDATSADAVAELVRRHEITHVMNAVDPRFVMPIFNGALAGGADYLDMAMSLSRRHPEDPWVTGTGKDGNPRSTYLYHVVDNQWSMAEYGHQCVVWQTAINPVVALELLANGTWSGSGVLGPEAFDSVPFLDLLTAYGSPWGHQELSA